MLYKIEKAIRSGIAKQVCADLPCTWNQNFATSVTAASVNNVMFYNCEAKEKLLSANTSSKVVNPTFAQKEKFLSDRADKQPDAFVRAERIQYKSRQFYGSEK